MELIIGIIVVLLLVWISIKVVKLLVKIVLWVIAIALILGLLGYYYPSCRVSLISDGPPPATKRK